MRDARPVDWAFLPRGKKCNQKSLSLGPWGFQTQRLARASDSLVRVPRRVEKGCLSQRCAEAVGAPRPAKKRARGTPQSPRERIPRGKKGPARGLASAASRQTGKRFPKINTGSARTNAPGGYNRRKRVAPYLPPGVPLRAKPDAGAQNPAKVQTQGVGRVIRARPGKRDRARK